MTTAAITIERSADSFGRTLRAENRSDNTIRIYQRVIRRFATWAKQQGVEDVADVNRRHLNGYLNELHDRGLAPATVSQRQSVLRSWATWLADDEWVDKSPAAKMRRVTVPEQPIPVPSDADIEALLAACKGRDFESRRDEAIVRVLMSTGIRRSECGNLRVEDVDLEAGRLTVMGKGRRRRTVTLSRKTIRALDRYLILRDGHPHRYAKALWIGRRGPLAPDTVYDVVTRRAKDAGLDHLHPHQLRHFWTDRMIAEGVSDSLIIHQAGWTNPAMLHRYGRANRGDRAHDVMSHLDTFDRF